MTATSERERVLDEVELAKRRVIDAGLKVIEAWAKKGRPFSVNDCRPELRAVGVKGASTGGLFNAAIAKNLIRPIGSEVSTDEGTHLKPVYRYVGSATRTPLESLLVPVQRSASGRFTTSTDGSGMDPLFEIGGTA